MKRLLSCVAWIPCGLGLALGAAVPGSAPRGPRPNIVFILADDLGLGDVHASNPSSRIPTPHFDQLAAEGRSFTDAHTPSSVCTPTRYGLLTGRYSWRGRLQSGVLGGLSPALIEPGRLTVAEFLRTNGYRTACIGKWHLGLGWATNGPVAELDIETRSQVFNVDYGRPIRNGPRTFGFDEFFGISASLDMVPYTFIRDDHVTALPTEDRRFPMIAGRTNGFTRQGPAAPGFTGEDVLPTLTREAIAFIARQAPAAKRGEPFFLYLPLTAPHTPILPNPGWRGRGRLNPYADFVMETDDQVGRVLDALARHGVADNTLVFLASDNGCSPSAGWEELVAAGHHPSGPYRGHKADIFEGGHRVPFFVRWPGHVQPGTYSSQLICLTDFMATVADLLGVSIPLQAGEDSISFLPALLGRSDPHARPSVVHHSINGSFAVREGSWKLALTPGSGGWSEPRPNTPAAAQLPPFQLYDLAADPGETNNLEARHPEIVSRLMRQLERCVANGRSTPGPARTNTTPVDLWNQTRERKLAALQAQPGDRPSIPLPPQLQSVLPATTDESGFRDLFTDPAAAGWAQCGPGFFTTQDGIATSHGGMGLWWQTGRLYTNFVLRGEWRCEHRDSDSGVFVRFPHPGSDPWSAVRHGHEVELGDDPENKAPAWRTGSLYPFQPPTHVPTRPVGEWNLYEIAAVGQTYIVRINGELVNAWTDLQARTGSGYIGLQNYEEGKDTQHRRLRIRDLP